MRSQSVQDIVQSLTPALKRDDVYNIRHHCYAETPRTCLHEVVRERWVNSQGSSLYVNSNDTIKAVNCCYGYLYPAGDWPYKQTFLGRVFRSFFLSLSSISKHKSHFGSWWAREDKETYIPWLVGSVIEESGPAGACPFCGNGPLAGGHARSRD